MGAVELVLAVWWIAGTALSAYAARDTSALNHQLATRLESPRRDLVLGVVSAGWWALYCIDRNAHLRQQEGIRRRKTIGIGAALQVGLPPRLYAIPGGKHRSRMVL